MPVRSAELVGGPQISITSQDVEADSLRMPPEMRGLSLTRPQTVSRIASNLYVRRALAQQAQAQSLDADPKVKAALQLARDKVLSDALLEKIDRDSAPTDAAAEAHARTIYAATPNRFKAEEQVQARHILISGNDAQAQERAEKVLQELKGGADFAQLAKERSADTGSASRGGDLGFFSRGRMAPEFEAAAFALKEPGELSGVVKTQFGYHVVKLEAKRPAGIRPFAEVKDELVKEVRAKVQQDARVAEAEKVQQGMQIRTEAVDAFAAQYKQ